jgi:hypothetical protein
MVSTIAKMPPILISVRGLNDLGRFSTEKITNREVLRLVCRVFDEIVILPTLPVKLFRSCRPPEEVEKKI